MSPVRLAVPAARRHPDVQVQCLGGSRLQQVKDVQPQNECGALGSGRFPLLHSDVEAAPELGPALDMRRGELRKGPGARDALARREPAFRDGAVARGVERDHLLDTRRLALFERHREGMPDAGCALPHEPGRGGNARLALIDAGARRLGDLEMRLRGSRSEEDRFIVDRIRLQRLQVSVGEAAIAGNSRIDDAPVEQAQRFERSGPVLGGYLEVDCREVGLAHVHEAPFAESRAAPVGLAEDVMANEQTFPEVQALTIALDLC